MTGKENRRKVAIMFTDIVGYSKMVENNESLAVKLLTEHDEIIEPIIISNNGRIIKHIGDAIFAEFPNVSEAVKSAVSFQKQLRNRNQLSRSEDRIVIRVGIHTGEVIEKDEDLFGNAVNLGSRIEGTATPGGIAVSEIVYNKIKTNQFHMRSMGYVKLKNIVKPLQIFKIYIDKKDFKLEDENSLRQKQIDRGINVVELDSYKEIEEFPVAFLYPHNIGGKSSDHSCFSFTDELIQDFKKIKSIRIPSIQDVIKFKDIQSPLSDIARKLEVHMVVDGSYLTDKEKIHLHLRMTNCETGEIKWEKKFSNLAVNMHQLKGEIISLVLHEFNLKIPDNIKKYLTRTMTKSSEALELYQKGIFLFERTSSNDDLIKAADFFEKAFLLDDRFIESRTQYAVIQSKLGYHAEAERIINVTLDYAKEDEYLEGIAMAYNGLGFICNALNNYDVAIDSFQNALKIQINLNDKLREAKQLSNLSGSYNMLGEPQKAKQYLAKAIRIQEEIGEDKTIAFPYAQMGNSCELMHNYTEAIDYFTKALGKFSISEMEYWQGKVLVPIAKIYITLGLFDKGKYYLDQATEICVSYNESIVIGTMYYLEGQLTLVDKNFTDCINYYNDAIDQFQLAESTYFLLQAIHELSIIHIMCNDFKAVKRESNKLLSISKKNHLEQYEQSAMINLLYIEVIESTSSNEAKSKFDEKISSYNNNMVANPLNWWVLGQLYLAILDDGKARNCFDNVNDSIKKLAEHITDKEQQKTYINKNIFNHFVSTKQSKINKESTAEDIISKFCPECGTQTQGGKFCMNCGHKLT
jgi:class 3 adenylate cyclase/TolB-like protein/Tfp pilus assembly protein PilF